MTTVRIWNARYSVETALTENEWLRGFSNRERPPSGCGMLFVCGRGENVAIWNRGMRFAIDVLWIGKSGEIVHSARLPPECASGTAEETCPEKAWYVLEIPAESTEPPDWKSFGAVRMGE